jgi:hypothetical protein
MNRKCKTISDVVGMTNTQVINNLLFIANNLIDFEEERFEDDVDDDDDDDSFDFEIWALETASARILTLSKLAYFFGVGFFVTNIFWLYNYLDWVK